MGVTIGIVGLILALAVLIVMIYKKIHPIFAAVSAAMVAGLFNLMEPWTILNTLASGIGSTFATYFYVFLLATIYGELMVATGCASEIADTLVRLFGKKNAVLVITLTTGLLVYGGVAAMVVAFTVFPIGVSLLREANISKTLLPAMIAMGQGTFALTALPGTPQLNNIIPTEVLGTTSTAGPVLGLIAAVLMFGFGVIYIQIQANRNAAKGIGFDESTVRPGSVVQSQGGKGPGVIAGFAPIILLLGLNLCLERVRFGSYKFSEHGTYSAVCTAMFLAIVYLCVLGIVRESRQEIGKTLMSGAADAIGPLLNFSTVVGFGYVIQQTAGFGYLVDLAISIPGPSYISAALAVCMLAGVTGSASGGMKIAMSSDILVNSWLADSTVNLGALHRIVSVASCGLDSLPHCGGILAALDICNETHASSYKHIFVVTVLNPILATVVIVALACLGIV